MTILAFGVNQKAMAMKTQLKRTKTKKLEVLCDGKIEHFNQDQVYFIKAPQTDEFSILKEKLAKARAIIKNLILSASWYSDEHHKAQDFLDCE